MQPCQPAGRPIGWYWYVDAKYARNTEYSGQQSYENSVQTEQAHEAQWSKLTQEERAAHLKAGTKPWDSETTKNR